MTVGGNGSLPALGMPDGDVADLVAAREALSRKQHTPPPSISRT